MTRTFGTRSKRKPASKSVGFKNATEFESTTTAPAEEKSYGVRVVEYWDMGAGQNQDRLWSTYFTAAEAIIWVVDSSSKKKVLESAQLLQQVLGDSSLPELTAILVMANKQDSHVAVDVSEIEKIMDLKKLSKTRKFKIFPCSVFRPPWQKKTYSAKTASDEGEIVEGKQDAPTPAMKPASHLELELGNASRPPPIVSGKGDIIACPWGLELAMDWLIETVLNLRNDKHHAEKMAAAGKAARQKEAAKKKAEKAKKKKLEKEELEEIKKVGMRHFVTHKEGEDVTKESEVVKKNYDAHKELKEKLKGIGATEDGKAHAPTKSPK